MPAPRQEAEENTESEEARRKAAAEAAFNRRRRPKSPTSYSGTSSALDSARESVKERPVDEEPKSPQQEADKSVENTGNGTETAPHSPKVEAKEPEEKAEEFWLDSLVQCPYCKKSVYSRGLEQHQKSALLCQQAQKKCMEELEPTEKWWQCPACPMWCRELTKMKKHLDQKHPGFKRGDNAKQKQREANKWRSPDRSQKWAPKKQTQSSCHREGSDYKRRDDSRDGDDYYREQHRTEDRYRYKHSDVSNKWDDRSEIPRRRYQLQERSEQPPHTLRERQSRPRSEHPWRSRSPTSSLGASASEVHSRCPRSDTDESRPGASSSTGDKKVNALASLLQAQADFLRSSS